MQYVDRRWATHEAMSLISEWPACTKQKLIRDRSLVHNWQTPLHYQSKWQQTNKQTLKLKQLTSSDIKASEPMDGKLNHGFKRINQSLHPLEKLRLWIYSHLRTWYIPLQTTVGSVDLSQIKDKESEKEVIPRNSNWFRAAAASIDRNLRTLY